MKVTGSCIPIGEFKARAKKHLADLVKNERPIIITQNGRAAAVLVPPELWDWYNDETTQRAIAAGEADIAAGRVVSHDAVVAETQARLPRGSKKKTVKRAVAAKQRRGK